MNFYNILQCMIENNKKMLLFCILIILVYSCTSPDGIVWVASPWQHVLLSTPPVDENTVNIKAAANEYEPFRLVVHNNEDQKLEDLTVTMSSLKSKGNQITADNISFYRAHYLHITKPSHRTDNPTGWYPDALIPFSDPNFDDESENINYIASPFSVDPGQNGEVWCDLFVPPGTEPGIYQGTVTVRTGRKRLARIPVHLTVWDFELPREIAMRSHFGPLHIDRGGHNILGIERDSKKFLKLEELYHKKLLKHRAVPTLSDNFWPEWNETQGVIDRGESKHLQKMIEVDGFNALRMPFRYKDEPEKCKAYLAATAEWLRKLGYLDMAYIYLKDEPNNAEEYEIVRQEGALIRSADPEIPRMCTEQTITTNPVWGDLYEAVDIWCPLWGLWDEPTARERLKNGEELWSYTALCQGPDGTPWWQIDMDPLNFRSPFWISWHYDITGYLYWSSTWWGPYETLQGVWEEPHFRKDFWGEGMLLYPGQPAGISGFVPSIRLKLYREAMEDYEYMVMASNLGKDKEVDRIVNGIATSFQDWSREREDYAIARERLAEIIINKR